MQLFRIRLNNVNNRTNNNKPSYWLFVLLIIFVSNLSSRSLFTMFNTISATSAAALAVAPYLKLFYLFTLPSAAEQIKGIEKLAENERMLLKKIFDRNNYDYAMPSDSPTHVLPFMFIDHIENLDQIQQVMTMHCTVLFHWIDKRIVWEPKDYGNVHRITRPKSDFPRMWFPAIHFTELRMRSDQALQYHNTDVTILNNGIVYAQVSISVRSTCSFDFSNYPRDEQSCLLTMFTPLPMSRLKFSRWTALTQRSDLFGRAMNGDDRAVGVSGETIRSGEFVLTETITKPLFILPFGRITSNDTADRPEVMRSIVRFEVKFKRLISNYILSISLPLFCISCITYMSAAVTDPKTSLIWLLMCLIAQILNYSQMIHKLPPDHINAPLCARLAMLIFGETLLLFLLRIVITYHHNNNNPMTSKPDEHPSKDPTELNHDQPPSTTAQLNNTFSTVQLTTTTSSSSSSTTATESSSIADNQSTKFSMPSFTKLQSNPITTSFLEQILCAFLLVHTLINAILLFII